MRVAPARDGRRSGRDELTRWTPQPGRTPERSRELGCARHQRELGGLSRIRDAAGLGHLAPTWWTRQAALPVAGQPIAALAGPGPGHVQLAGGRPVSTTPMRSGRGGRVSAGRVRLGPVPAAPVAGPRRRRRLGGLLRHGLLPQLQDGRRSATLGAPSARRARR